MLRFGARSFPTRAGEGARMRSRVSRLSLLEPLPQLSGRSRFELIGKVRVLFGIVGVFVGIYAYSPTALAEVEDGTNKSVSSLGYDISTLSYGLTASFSVNNITDDEVHNYLSTLDSHYSNTEYTGTRHTFFSSNKPNGSGEALIPEAVWGFDVVHLDRISDGLGSEMYAASGETLKSTDFWSRTTIGLWDDNNTGQVPKLLIASPQLQVASCGGSAAERSNLEYCNSSYINDDQNNSTNAEKHKDSSTIQATDSNPILWSDPSSSSLRTQSDISPFTLATANKFLLHGALSFLGQCGGVSVSCATIQIGAPETITPPPPGSPTLPIDDLTPPTDPSPFEVAPPVVYDPGSGSGLPPVFTPQPLKPIPEAPTWVMMITGFGIMVFVCRKGRRRRVNPISIIDVSEV